ncbi:MAG: hypothetical protein NVSMB6_14240 [Burkholderiaceae bacterium]
MALIPMAVRYRLDACHIKLSLRGWARLTHAQKEALVAADVETPAQQDHYPRHVEALGAGEVTPITPEPFAVCGISGNVNQVPLRVAFHCASLGVPAPTVEQWQALDPLQRYVLEKVSLPGKKNTSFLPAMLEFALMEPSFAA